MNADCLLGDADVQDRSSAPVISTFVDVLDPIIDCGGTTVIPTTFSGLVCGCLFFVSLFIKVM